MVAVVSSNINSKTPAAGRGRPNHAATPTRPPLLPSDPDNALAPRRPKAREVTSRYMSASSSNSATPVPRRCPSPLVSRTPAMTPPAKRSHSSERSRASTPRRSSNLDLITRSNGGGGRGGEVSAAQKMLFTSARSLSVSFQGESFSLQVSKVKQAPLASPSPSLRKGTPERRKSVEQQRWPGRLRQPNAMSKSFDFTDERKKTSGSGNVVRVIQNSIVDDRSCYDIDGGLSSNSSNAESEKVIEVVFESNSAIVASDTESVSSGSSSGVHDCGVPGGGGGGGHGQRGPRGIVVPARFWQETNNRLRRHQELASPASKNNGFKSSGPPKLILPKKLANDSPSSSPHGALNNRGQSSPIRGPIRPATPSKLVMTSASSPMRGMSPSRLPGTMSNNFSNTPSILSFAVDVRRGKVGENMIGDAHQLRLLYNRVMQWRFVNARAESSLFMQKLNAEKSLYTAWVSTSKLRESVRAKRTELQLQRENLKLTSILKGQMAFLEDWALMDRDYSCSLLGATEALRASTLRLPVVGGARADIQKVNDAISSAVDVMQAMASSTRLMVSKVDEANSLVSELANVSAKERALLDQCKDFLSTVASMQVKDCSLRTHVLQQKRLPSSLTTQV